MTLPDQMREGESPSPRVVLCPVFIARFGGLHAGALWNGGEAICSHLERIADSEEALRALQKQVCDQLHAILSSASARKKVIGIQLRREIHNGRWKKAEKCWAQFQQEARGDSSLGIERALEMQRTLNAMRDSAERELEAYLATLAGRQQRQFSQSSVALGFMLSAPASWARILAPAEDNAAKPGMGKSLVTLLRYTGRCAGKTSPFSYFGPSAYGEVGQTTDIPLNIPSGRSYAVINSRLVLAALRQESRRRGLEKASRPVWNSSLQFHDGAFLWLTQERNVATIVRLPRGADPAVDALLDQVLTAEGTQRRGGAGGPPPDCVDMLRQAGLLVDSAESGRPFAEELATCYGVNSSLAAGKGTFPEFCRIYHDNLSIFRRGVLDERTQAYQKISEAITRLEEGPAVPFGELPRTSPRNILLEDVVLEKPVRLSEEEIHACAGGWTLFQRAFGKMDFGRMQRRALASMYHRWFPSAARVPLVAYLERIFTECAAHKKNGEIKLSDYLFSLVRGLKIPSSDPEVGRINDWLRLVRSTTPGILDLEQTARELNRACRERVSGTVCVYAQRIPGRTPAWVVNGASAGGSGEVRRWFSYNDKFLEAFGDWHRRAFRPEGTVEVALPDDLYAHIDRGARLHKTVFEIPGIIPLDGAVDYLPLGACFVSVDEQGLLSLRTESGRLIRTYYDSLVSARRRSLAIQFLQLFGRSGCNVGFRNIESPLRATAGTGYMLKGPVPGVDQFARVIMGAGLVLKRAKWHVAIHGLPRPSPDSTKLDVVRQYQAWRRQLNLPDEVFVKTAGADSGPKANDDAQKPQYINWADPAWVLFFHRYASRCGHAIEIEEALPGPLSHFGNGHVQEFILHWHHDNGLS